MSLAYLQAQKKHLRVTLDLEVYEDFNARQIDFTKLFELEGDESVNVYVEEEADLW